METSLYQARTLARTNDPETSKAAAVMMVESGALNRQEKEVYYEIKLQKAVYKNSDFTYKEDFTAKEIAAKWSLVDGDYNQRYYTVQRRFSGLANKGKIELTGARRDGCRAWRLK